MEQWLIQFNRKMVIQKRKILLFLDNASSHPHLKLSNIELVFLPPNTTSHTQPLDQGIINSFTIETSKLLDTSNSSDEDDEDDAYVETDSAITHGEALMCLDRIKAYTCKEGLSTLLSKTAECAILIQDNVFTKRTKQTTIGDYFKKTST
ncbi:tigger transposable element-derived protein 6-like [Sitodiplosis mosellana]|uniref:tigger transposable element-derived protein 6-like n=1 Tax=Sitodiplosis mosellana TaxID=263140 RepID=UPI00244386BA|nr:tigger transposable element-derived protein 6-like [Sitodiplosis mosellana]